MQIPSFPDNNANSLVSIKEASHTHVPRYDSAKKWGFFACESVTIKKQANNRVRSKKLEKMKRTVTELK